MFSKQTKEQKLETQNEEERLKLQQARIKNAKTSEIHRGPNPDMQIRFPEEDFIPFVVLNDKLPLKLRTYRFSPSEETIPKAIVFLFHGLYAHMNHGAHVAKELAQIGCIVVGFDYRGLGKSEGERGYLESIKLHLEDCNLFVDLVINFYASQGIKGLPIFLMGLSLGGLTSFRLAIQRNYQIRGIVMFAPAIKSPFGSTLVKLAKTIGKIMPKNSMLSPKRKSGLCSKNPQIEEEQSVDCLNYNGEMLPGTTSSILSGMIESNSMFPLLTVPWCMVQGGLDKLVDPDCARDLERLSPSKDKTVLFYDDCWHDIWHEKEITHALPLVVRWVAERY